MGGKNIYDVVFMDIRMKVLNSVQTTQEWKDNQNILDNNTPIVALTADTLDIKQYQEKNIFFKLLLSLLIEQCTKKSSKM